MIVLDMIIVFELEIRQCGIRLSFPPYLHCDKSVIHHDFFRQEISTYCGFVLVTELLIHILVHQRSLPNSRRKHKIKDNIQSM